MKEKPIARRPRWTKEEVEVLKKMYRSHSNQEIAQALGRTASSVLFKGFYMGLCKGPKRLREMGISNIAKRWGK
jgi:hypothetical protein